ncbi:Brp/Blh family beta-carotene 15,15'-dioxygenase [Aureimonas leprariae]|uniref:Probable beta-carotene 15,15'-dioxygenase n=1 Tax=Plantimonas leprariae TaxID=2615207 RepID=A0A7V7TUM2_9HYPH|nr:Brp/Blh family beta-carotene 15,15'-dioxygenase [Aureimonas leprariae]KAB0676205.1 hypothetical protein F6X38_21935 [Aureimonas leprariae]
MSISEREPVEAARSLRPRSLHDLRSGQALLASLAFRAVCGAVAVAGPPNAGTQLALLVPAVAVALPHGALDGRDGKRLFVPQHGRLWFVPFLGSYAALSMATLLLWWFSPFLALSGFLLISLVHFGQCDRETASSFPRASVLARGGIPIVLPTLAFPDEVGRLFAWLAGERNAAVVLALLVGPVAVVWLAAVAVEVAQALLEPQRRRPGDALTALSVAGALALLFATVPPLLAFALYFSLFHASRALLQATAGEGTDPRTAIGRAMRDAVPLSIAAIAIGAILFLFQPAGAATPAVLRAVFLLLSALTVPHMWLEHRLRIDADSMSKRLEAAAVREERP